MMAPGVIQRAYQAEWEKLLERAFCLGNSPALPLPLGMGGIRN